VGPVGDSPEARNSLSMESARVPPLIGTNDSSRVAEISSATLTRGDSGRAARPPTTSAGTCCGGGLSSGATGQLGSRSAGRKMLRTRWRTRRSLLGTEDKA
jgi:hypothetical protein